MILHFGEAFTTDIERRLKALGEKLMREGVAYKEFHGELDGCFGGICSGTTEIKDFHGRKQGMAVMETSPYAGATTWDALHAYEDNADVWGEFAALLANIRASRKSPAEQGNLVVAAAQGLTERLSGLTASKGLSEWGDAIYEDLAMIFQPPLARYTGFSQKELPEAAEEFAQALEGDPAGIYLADLARHGAAQE